MAIEQALQSGFVLQGGTYRYEIVKALGQGSFGITYLANAKIEGPLGVVDMKVAIKEFFMKEVNGRKDSVVTSASSKNNLFVDYRRKFRREALNLSKMHHPHIVRVVESFDANNTTYIVMEFIEGGSLDNRIAQKGALSEEESLRLIRQIGSALAYMHSNRMIHLDMKPANVMLNGKDDAVLIDFGLSKQYDEQGEPESSTKVGGGTPGYAPIEQSAYREGKDFPITMDVYAMGATLFKMLTGKRPPEASDIFNDGFPYGMLESCNVSATVIDAIAKSMQSKKMDRFQSVPEFIEALSPDTDESTSMTGEVEVEAVEVSDPADGPQEKEPVSDGPMGVPEQGTNDTKEKARKPKVLLVAASIALVVVAIVLLVVRSKNTESLNNIQVDSVVPIVENQIYMVDGKECRYSGSWVNGMPEGDDCVLIYNANDSDGRMSFKGSMSEGQRVEGKLMYKDGEYYEGTFVNDNPYNGEWHYKNGKLKCVVTNGKDGAIQKQGNTDPSKVNNNVTNNNSGNTVPDKKGEDVSRKTDKGVHDILKRL